MKNREDPKSFELPNYKSEGLNLLLKLNQSNIHKRPANAVVAKICKLKTTTDVNVKYFGGYISA